MRLQLACRLKTSDCVSIDEVINLDIDVSSDDEFVSGGYGEKKRRELVKKGIERLRIR